MDSELKSAGVLNNLFLQIAPEDILKILNNINMPRQQPFSAFTPVLKQDVQRILPFEGPKLVKPTPIVPNLNKSNEESKEEVKSERQALTSN